MEGGRKDGREKEKNQGKEVKKLRRQRLFLWERSMTASVYEKLNVSISI